jgi:hypothetical protein
MDLLATHPYANFTFPGGGLETAEMGKSGYWFLYRDFRPAGWRDRVQPGRPHDVGGILAQFPGKPLLITETGTFVHGDVGRTPDTIDALGRLYQIASESGRVVGITPFIWNAGPEHAGNRIWYNEALRNWFETMQKFSAPDLPKHGSPPVPVPVTPGPVPVPVPVTPGSGDWPRPLVVVEAGEKSWYAVLRKMGVAATAGNVAALQNANRDSAGQVPPLRVGQYLLSPFHEVGLR